MTTTEPEQTDHSWENRRLILASLAPRTTTRPARRTTPSDPTPPTAEDTDTAPKKPSILTRGIRSTRRLAAAGGRKFNEKVPPNRRAHTAVLTAAALVVLVVATAGINYLTADINPQAHTPTTAAPPPPPPANLPPLQTNTILTGAQATDNCPRDANYADANRAFDGDFTTAWTCTRAKNDDGQLMQVDFGRQTTLSQVRAIGGFDATAPDGTDQWGKHRIVTKYEIYFPKELNREPVTLTTDGARDWRFANITPPAIVSKLLVRVAETSDPPQTNSPTNERDSDNTTDDTTTVATSEIQFIGSEIHST